MLFSEDYLSESDKIDRIYKMLRSEQRARRFGLFLKLCILSGIVYGAYYLSLPANEDVRTRFTTSIQSKISELVLPMVGTMIQDMTKDMTQDITTSASGAVIKKRNIPSSNVKITPEMIEAVQNSMKK